MVTQQSQFLTEASGNRIGAVLNMQEYERFLAMAEELESLRAYDAAKDCGDERIDFDQAIREIERDRP